MRMYIIQLECTLEYGQHDNLHEYSDIIKIIKKKEQHTVEIIHMLHNLFNLMFDFFLFQRRRRKCEREKKYVKK